jgi:hypothetical protein
VSGIVSLSVLCWRVCYPCAGGLARIQAAPRGPWGALCAAPHRRHEEGGPHTRNVRNGHKCSSSSHSPAMATACPSHVFLDCCTQAPIAPLRLARSRCMSLLDYGSTCVPLFECLQVLRIHDTAVGRALLLQCGCRALAADSLKRHSSSSSSKLSYSMRCHSSTTLSMSSCQQGLRWWQGAVCVLQPLQLPTAVPASALSSACDMYRELRGMDFVTVGACAVNGAALLLLDHSSLQHQKSALCMMTCGRAAQPCPRLCMLTWLPLTV